MNERDAGLKRRLLDHAVEQHWPDVLIGVRIYIRKFGLSRDRNSDEALARDVLQDAILLALENADKFDPARPARPWILGFALNCLRHARRSEAYERKHIIPVAEIPEVRSAEAESGPLSEDEMFGLLYHSTQSSRPPDGPCLEDLLAPLTDGDRAVLRLHFVHDLRGKDLAAALGMNEGRAWARLSRAKARLRELYQKERTMEGIR